MIDTIAQSIDRGEFEVAEALVMEALAIEPDSLPHRVKLASCLLKQLRFGEAAEQWLWVLGKPDLDLPSRIAATHGLAICAAQSGQPSLVLPYADTFDLRSSPHTSDRCWYPRILSAAGYDEEAEAATRALLKDEPGDPFIRQCLGAIWLQLGDTAGYRGFLEFSTRRFFQSYYGQTLLIDRMWEGENLDGQSIAIVPHGGFGDYFQFVRYVPTLKAMGARTVTIAGTPRAHHLLASSGVDEVVADYEIEAVKERSDRWVGSYGLAWAAERHEAVEGRGGYLRAPPSETATAIAEAMRARAAGRPCIGLYWHSDMHLGEAKSVPLQALAPLFARTDIHLLILQRGFGLRRMVEAGLGADATVVGEELSFDETGTLITALDGVATICAWPFHLSGALGVRTWLLASRVMDGRHLNRERTSVLYPENAKLVRQPAFGDWPGAVARLMSELDALASPVPSAG